MSMTIGSGPFGPKRAGRFNFGREVPEHVLYLEPSPKRVRVELGSETVAESRGVKLLHETGYLPVYYFPQADVRSELLEPSDHRTHCPFKGDARYWHVRTAGQLTENAVWAYPAPLESCPPIADHVAFYFDRMDAWYEEDERIEVHPRDPYHRVDVRRTNRPVRIRVHGELVADTTRARVLFETSLPPRYYVPPEDVRDGLLEPSDKVTGCPYKGKAQYWSVRIGNRLAREVAWSYENPLPEGLPVRGYRCFLGESVDLEIG